MNYEKIKQIGVVIIIVIAIIILGMVAINQTLGFFYKSQFLQSPCALCVDINPEWGRCYDIINSEMKNPTQSNSIEFDISKIEIK